MPGPEGKGRVGRLKLLSCIPQESPRGRGGGGSGGEGGKQQAGGTVFRSGARGARGGKPGAEPGAGSPVPSPGRGARRRAGARRGAAAGAVTATPLGTPGRPSVYAESRDAQARGKDLQIAVLK